MPEGFFLRAGGVSSVAAAVSSGVVYSAAKVRRWEPMNVTARPSEQRRDRRAAIMSQLLVERMRVERDLQQRFEKWRAW